MGELYSISGFYEQIFAGTVAFGGFFFRNNNKLEGDLLDDAGASAIDGVISDTDLQFLKRYKGRKDIIQYVFTRQQNGFWVGRWTQKVETGGNGRAICKINKDFDDVTRRRITREEYFHNFIKGMDRTGMVEIYKDPETGEDMVKPK